MSLVYEALIRNRLNPEGFVNEADYNQTDGLLKVITGGGVNDQISQMSRPRGIYQSELTSVRTVNGL